MPHSCESVRVGLIHDRLERFLQVADEVNILVKLE